MMPSWAQINHLTMWWSWRWVRGTSQEDPVGEIDQRKPPAMYS
jgi:hypothetical protein